MFYTVRLNVSFPEMFPGARDEWAPNRPKRRIGTYIQGVRAKFDTFCFHYISELLQDIDIG